MKLTTAQLNRRAPGAARTALFPEVGFINMAESNQKAESKRVLDVGQCRHDHGMITRLLSGFGARVDRVKGLEEARRALREARYDLVLVNRQLDSDGSPGVDVVRAIKTDADPALAAIPVMLVSNFPEAQDEAVAAGATRGFGKAELNDPQTTSRLAAVLG